MSSSPPASRTGEGGYGGSPGSVARKWRRKALKRLNQRPEMVASRKPQGHKMWYTCAGLTVRSD
jgi:hypothetical protein